jgi:hypothetical protein
MLPEADSVEVPDVVGPPYYDSMWDDVGDRRMGYYGRQGNRISLRQWSMQFMDKRVAESLVTTAGGLKLWVSTVWLGIDHRFWGDGPPVIFETMVFPEGHTGFEGLDLDMDRYCHLTEAFRGHDEMVGRYAQDWWLDLGGIA